MTNKSAIGMIEMNSIAKGYAVGDAMLKAANVEILFNRTICPGKFMVMVAGDVAAVEASMTAGLELGDATIVDELIIPNVHPSVFAAIGGTRVIEHTDALGIIETFSVATIIEAADAAVKAANVELIDIHLAMAIGGKGFLTLTGDVAAVTAAVEAGTDYIKRKGMLVDKVVIPQPRKEILQDKL
ncbi:microcompartment protein CcmL/EutN [Marinobacter sp. LV10R520-4]|uniref:BMC domain-containing protein n=1 Tax=Marinobacter sp. LV10R520-4 TaxID=1761796 RepID=UPI000BF79E94|nr:BMC domain-containing protein [Marinobacter sp. LV10R520-4]PFG54874.1 microcompartment protein CcmL/EutN [Marinobacter sp. LV10R520-4]